MSSRNSHPKWWQLYLTFPLLIVLFIVDSRLKISNRGHQVVQIGIVLLVYGLIHLWLKANARALRQMEEGEYRRTFTAIEILPAQLPDTDKHLVFQIPDSEIKGVLDDTFERNYIDAEFSSLDNISQELKKE